MTLNEISYIYMYILYLPVLSIPKYNVEDKTDDSPC